MSKGIKVVIGLLLVLAVSGWVAFGIVVGLINTVGQTLVGINTTLPRITENVDILKSRLSGLETQGSQLRRDVQSAKEKLSQVEEKLSNVEKKLSQVEDEVSNLRWYRYGGMWGDWYWGMLGEGFMGYYIYDMPTPFNYFWPGVISLHPLDPSSLPSSVSPPVGPVTSSPSSGGR